MKTILYLVNGLGIEKKDSYPVYNNKVMPNFDKLLNNNFFTTLESDCSNYKNAYQLFSTGSMKLPEHSFLENLLFNEEVGKVNNFIQLRNAVNNDKNLHIFVELENTAMDQLSDFLKQLKLDGEKSIFIHLVLKNDSIDSYKKIYNSYNYMRFKIGSNAKLGAIVGSEVLYNPTRQKDLLSFAKLLFKGFGEKWNEPLNKLRTHESNGRRPCDINAFYVNNITLKENDCILFFNYGNSNLDNLINTLKTPISFVSNEINLNTLLFVSLFPLQTASNIPSIFGHVVSEYSIKKAVEDNKLNMLIIADNMNIPIINYMANGLSNDITANIKYMAVDERMLNNPNALSMIINDSNNDLVIINTRVDDCNTINDLNGKLYMIDQNIKMVSDMITDQTLIISSLYGISKKMNDLNNNEVLVNFRGKVPMIYVTKKYSKADYKLYSGGIYSLLGTTIKSVDPSIRCETLLRKKGFVEKLMKK